MLDKLIEINRKEEQIIYTGSSELTLTIPAYFRERGYYIYSSETGNINFLAIAEIKINNKTGTLIIPTMMETIPYDIEETSDKIILKYNKGDALFTTDYIIASRVELYNIFTSFMTLGKDIPYLDYQDFIYIFDNLQLISNKTLSNRVAFELLYAETCRDTNDLNTRYKNTTMKKPHTRISLRNIAYGPSSVNAKIIGTYFNDGLTSSLLVEENETDTSNKIETLLKS